MHWGVFAIAGGLGLIFGSFLNVVIHRGPEKWGLTDESESRGGFSAPRSYCPSCRERIPLKGLIPIVGYFLLGRKCASCQAAIPPRYPLVEAMGALAGLICVLHFGVSVEALLAAVFLLTLLALAAIDLETGFLPDALTIPLLAAGIAFNTVDLFATFPMALLGGLLGYGSFKLIEAAYRTMRGRDGLGGGDAKLLGAIGAWVGAVQLPAVVFIGAVTTLASVMILRLTSNGDKLKGDDPLPFGPGLAFGGALALFFGQGILG